MPAILILSEGRFPGKLRGVGAAVWLLAALVTPVAGQTAVPTDDPALQIRPHDILELKSGRTIEGEVLEERNDDVLFRQVGGIQSRLPRSDIRRILRRNPPRSVYETRVRRYFDPASVEDQRTLAEWCLSDEVGLVDRGIHHLEEAAVLAPRETEIYERLLPYYRAADPDDRTTEENDRELATCLLAVESGVEMPALRVHAAERLADLGDRRGAILLLGPLADRPPGDPVVERGQDRLAEWLDRVGRRDEARGHVDRWLAARDAGTGRSLLHLRASWLLEDVAADVEGAAETLDGVLADLLDADPDDGRAYYYRATLAMLRGNTERATADFSKAFENGETGGEVLVSGALNFARAGQSDQARDVIAMAREVSSVAELRTLVEAYALENRGDTELADALYRDILAMPDRSWQSTVIALQGRARLDPGFPIETEARRALERQGSVPAAFAELSLLLGDRALADGRTEEARRWLGYALHAGRIIPEALLRQGIAHLAQGGDRRIARACLEEAVGRDPDDPAIRNALGCLEYRTGELERAREQFERTLALVPAPDGEDPVPEPRRYALAALEQIDRTIGEEVWTDDFEREGGPQILNNWEKSETFGVTIELHDGAVRFSGTQKFRKDGLTRLHRPVEGSTLARVRAHLRIEPSAPARIGLRLARAEGNDEGEGVVAFRDLDGTIAIAMNTSQGSTVLRTDATEDVPDDLVLVPTVWPDDASPHWLELRMPREEGDRTASLYLDGELVARGIPLPRLSGRSGTVVGVSGQADLDRSYGFELLDFEIFRRRPTTDGERSSR